MKFKIKTNTNPPQTCIDCSLCTKSCDFLDKYKLNLYDFSKKQELAYNCFLCDTCYEVCPKDIKGSDISLDLRKKVKKNFGLLRFKKQPYLFENNSLKKSEELMFFGCNFVGYYPKTTKKIIKEFGKIGIDFSIDCCGKPLFEASLSVDKTKNHLNELFLKKGVKTLITACPNCYHFLKNRLEIKIISLYEKLEGLKMLEKIDEEIHLFTPCPEKNNFEIYNSFSHKLSNVKHSFSDVNCCGAGGLAKQNEKEIAHENVKKVHAKNTPNLYTYCATCSGQFGKNAKHIAGLFLKTDEIVSKKYALNVLAFKFYDKKRANLKQNASEKI